MRILVISQYYFPEQFQINEIAPALVAAGHQVTVVCGLPNYPKGEIFEGYKGKKYRHEYINGVEIIRCLQYPRGHNVVSLILNYVSYPFFAENVLKKIHNKYDVILSYQLSPITSVLPAIKYKKHNNIPLLLYCLDIWPESARNQLGKIKPLYRRILKLSQKIYNSCDRILVTSLPFIDYLHDVDEVPISKMGYLPQHASLEMINLDLTADDNGVIDFMFAGNLGAGQNLQTIVEAAKLLGPRPDYKVHFVGDGSQRLNLEKQVAAYGLGNNFIFYGNQDRKNMPTFYKKADVLLISLRGNNAVGNTLPGKLQTYMTVGKPIIGAINGAANSIIREARCGQCVSAGDYVGLSKKMLHVIENFSLYEECGINARQYFLKNFTLEKYMSGLIKELENIIHHEV